MEKDSTGMGVGVGVRVEGGGGGPSSSSCTACPAALGEAFWGVGESVETCLLVARMVPSR